MTEQTDGQMSLFDRGSWSGKTSPELSAATGGKISESFSKKRSGSPNRQPLFLDLRKTSGLMQDALWETDGLSLGEYSMRSFGECPKEDAESHLSQILEEMPHPKYCLSAKACQGILNRAKRRKKQLPLMLAVALKRQVQSAFRNEQDAKGGKEYSYSTTGQEHYQRSTISECYGISAYASNAMKSDNPHSGIYKADTARTLDLNGGSPACNQGGMAIVSLLNDQGGSSICGDDDAKVAPTIRAKMHGNVPAVVYDARGNGDGIIVPTITGDHENRVTDYTAVCIGNGQADQLGMSEKVGALNCMHDQQAIMTQAVVRRLTPLECERLQGFPDGWTDIGDWTDSKGKKHKAADSPRYRALGNSIALPSWIWVLSRLNKYCKEHTMASLFDGIGGFPLIWEQINGKGLCLWTSEIEEFPMAVTKIRFGGE